MKMFAAAVIFFSLACPLHAASNHYYFTGVVNSISSDTITVSGRLFRFAPKVEVVSQERSSRGNFQERNSRIGNVSSGTPVIVRVEGAMVNRITIEEWKR
jgi:hypothetical protein